MTFSKSGGFTTRNVVVNATGGTPPYTYSNNNGATYVSNPLFSGLFVGTTYVFSVKDSLGTTIFQSLVV